MARRAFILVETTKPNGVGPLYIQTAQRLGLHPIALSSNPAQYEDLAAEKVDVIRADPDDLEGLVRKCSRLRATYEIAGITSANESVYAAVGRLCRYFDLPGPNPASIEQCCDKFTQRQLLAEAGVPIPAYRLVTNAADVERSATEIGLPVIVKPAVGTGSSGVRLCRNVDELAEHTAYGSHIWRISPRVLVEEFAQGPQYTVQIMGNEVIGVVAAEFGPPPHFVFRRFTFPALLTKRECGLIADVSLSCLQALGLGWGPTNIELRWTNRGPVVIEVNPRLSGVPDPQLVQLAHGVDLIAEHIKLAIGEKWDLRRRHSQSAAARILVPDNDGILDWIGDDSRAAALSGVAEVKLYVEPNTPIVRKGDSQDWIGHVIAASPSRAGTEAILQRAVDLIGWSITPFPTISQTSRSPGPAQVAPDKR